MFISINTKNVWNSDKYLNQINLFHCDDLKSGSYQDVAFNIILYGIR